MFVFSELKLSDNVYFYDHILYWTATIIAIILIMLIMTCCRQFSFCSVFLLILSCSLFILSISFHCFVVCFARPKPSGSTNKRKERKQQATIIYFIAFQINDHIQKTQGIKSENGQKLECKEWNKSVDFLSKIYNQKFFWFMFLFFVSCVFIYLSICCRHTYVLIHVC